MYQRHRREMTPQERRTVQAWARPDYLAWISIGLLFVIIPGLLLGQLAWWVGGAFLPGNAGLWRLVGWGVAVLVFWLQARPYLKRSSLQQEQLQSDLENGFVEEIAVSYCSSRIVVDEHCEDVGLLFDLGQNQGLWLSSEVIRERQEVYGPLPYHDATHPALEEIYNGLPAPFSFPSDRFVVTRLPISGKVVSLQIHGDYLGPEGEVTLAGDLRSKETELMDQLSPTQKRLAEN